MSNSQRVHSDRGSSYGCRGFTLVELLLVIGIIALLISILLPTVTRVRVAAQTANTKQMLNRLEAAISMYYNDFQAYPGPFSNAQVGTPSPDGLVYMMDGTTDNSRPNLTSTENLFLGIVGGLRINGGTLEANFTSTSLPNGPLSLNTVNPKRYQVYLSVEPAETTAMTAPRFFPTNAKGFGGETDTRVPEVLDKYSNPMPILYLRANRGSSGFITTDNAGQYNFSHLAPYGFANISADYTTDSRDGSISRSFRYFGNETTSSSSVGVPHKKDAFILISAGPDGKYGTADDITNYRN